MTTPMQDPTDPSKWIIGDVTGEVFGEHRGNAVIVNVHPPSACADRPSCVMHRPSAHHMRTWPLTWRGDKGVMERGCPHGVGHPDPDDADYLASVGRSAWTIHGCDSCCTPPTNVV